MYDNINRLLVVDSDPEVIEQVRRIGADASFSLADAGEPSAFLKLVDEFRPTVIVLDMDLPGSDGVESLRSLASRGCKASIVLMGSADRRVMAATKSIGTSRGLSMTCTITKPIDDARFMQCLMELRQQDRTFSAEDIEQALDRDEFVAFYQPQASLVEGGGWSVDGIEALVRWQHPSFGLVMPDEFIPQAERGGLIGRLTEKVLTQTLTELKGWTEAGIKLRASVNLPPVLVTDLAFPDRVSDLLTQHAVDPSQLSFELTETATMQDPTTSMDILTRLRVKGIGLSIDDFGTGYSSLTRLYQMPFDEMKIDRSLVMNVPGSREANTIVGSLIELAHNLGLHVCTEGVETRAALDLLEVLKSDRCQGFFISRALPPAEIASFIAHWNHQSPASAQKKQFRAVI
ncbi:MAG: EAL domain-containing response regulator [Gammaproteobacteria bacterium]|nr:EAL domain-containing response regulator [Gammaproteobacteria bacterium]